MFTNSINSVQPYRIQFHFVDDDNKPYAYTHFSIRLSEGEKVGITDEQGFTPIYFSHTEENVKIRLHIEESEMNEWRWDNV